MDNIIPLFGSVLHDEPAESVLEKAKAWEMKECLIVGQDERGEFLFGGNISDLKEIVWVLQRALWACARTEETLNGSDLPRFE